MMALLVGLRGAAAVFVLAALAGGIPRLAQLGLAVVAGAWLALVVPAAPLDDGLAAAVLIGARELVLGAAIGIAAAVPLLVAATAGRLVDAAGREGAVYRRLFGILAAAVFVGIDGHVAVISAVADSTRTVPVVLDVQPRVLDALGAIVASAVRLAIPWLVTAAVVELAVGVGQRIGGRAAAHLPGAAAVPAALAMMTAALVATLAVGVARLMSA
ncbi:MAG: flagellar biosynthetic protein FliR [Deltaproteobacteria bacterium]|nr:flagellar biosynthetic protein FliR [Deltaproteobacteria bacterium]